MSLPNIYFYSFKIPSFYESTLISLYLVEPHNFRKYGTVSLKNVVWNHYTLCMIFYSKWASVKSAEDHSGHKSESVWNQCTFTELKQAVLLIYCLHHSYLEILLRFLMQKKNFFCFRKKAVFKSDCYLYTFIKKEISRNAFNWNAGRIYYEQKNPFHFPWRKSNFCLY